MITVVVPVYNAEKYLDECLLSILGQSFSNFELLLFIGKCTDSSRQICEKYRESDSRIQIYDQIKVGPGGARNQGLDMARGKYIYFCDADDYLVKDCLKTFYDIAEAGNHDIVESNAFIITQKDEKWAAEPLGCSFWAMNIGHDYVERTVAPSVWKFFSRVDLWKNNNIRFADFLTSMDDLATYSLLFKSAKNPRFILNNLYCYRVFGDSLSRNPLKIRGRLDNIYKICNYLSTEFKKRNMYDENRLSLANQMEHHGNLILHNIADISDDELILQSQKLSECIKENFEVTTTVFECGTFSWGSSLVHTLANRIAHCPIRGQIKYSGKSIWKQNYEEIEAIAGSIKACNANIAVIDLISEVQNLDEIDDMATHLTEWKSRINKVFSIFSQNLDAPAKIIIIENYYCLLDYSGEEICLFDNHDTLEFFNEVLGLYYSAAKEALPEAYFMPAAPVKLMFSEKGDPTSYNSCVTAYHLGNTMDAISK